MIALASDGMTVACSSENSVRFWSADSRKKIGRTLSLARPNDFVIANMAFSPDGSTLAIAILESFTDSSHSSTLLLCRITDSTGPAALITEIPCSSEWDQLFYHPTGDYICRGNQAWKLSPEPSACEPDSIRTILDETFLGVLSYDLQAPIFPAIQLGSPTRQTFYLPPDFNVQEYAIDDGFMALGGNDGRVMVLDFTRLLTPREVSLGGRISKP